MVIDPTSSGLGNLTKCRPCDGALVDHFSDPQITIFRCLECGSLSAVHKSTAEGDYWNEQQAPREFLDALSLRRESQAKVIADWLQDYPISQPILDYGTGLGHLVSELKQRGIQAWGADLQSNLERKISATEIVGIDSPWQVPSGEWLSIALLDVLEHHEAPVDFLRARSQQWVLLKLPSSNGPLCWLARAVRLKWSSPLRSLFLVGDVSPHQWLATRRGIRGLAVKSGFEVVFIRAIPEVGPELPERLRMEMGLGAAGWLLRIFGRVLALVGRGWSDSHVALLRKSATNTPQTS